MLRLALRLLDLDAHRDALHDLDPVASGILRWQHGELRAGRLQPEARGGRVGPLPAEPGVEQQRDENAGAQAPVEERHRGLGL